MLIFGRTLNTRGKRQLAAKKIPFLGSRWFSCLERVNSPTKERTRKLFDRKDMTKAETNSLEEDRTSRLCIDSVSTSISLVYRSNFFVSIGISSLVRPKSTRQNILGLSCKLGMSTCSIESPWGLWREWGISFSLKTVFGLFGPFCQRKRGKRDFSLSSLWVFSFLRNFSLSR